LINLSNKSGRYPEHSIFAWGPSRTVPGVPDRPWSS